MVLLPILEKDMEINQKNKKEIRAEMIARRKNLTEEEIRQMSGQCLEHLMTLREFVHAETVFLYMDIDGEVRTKELLEYCLAHKKKVAIPRVEGKRTMNFYEIYGMDNIEPGYCGIAEPVTDKIIFPDAHSCMIVPGIAFDKQGNRMGYGGGYYDTYCKKFPDINRIGLCYHWQVLECIPAEAHDMKMNQLVTDFGVG